jgi:hypothetical protein
MTLTTLIEQVKAADAKVSSTFIDDPSYDKKWGDRTRLFINVTPALAEMLEEAVKRLEEIVNPPRHADAPSFTANAALARINAIALAVSGKQIIDRKS